MSEKLLEKELKPLIQLNLERYTGYAVPEQLGDDYDVIINEYYSIIQYNLPSIFFRNPRVFLKPRNKTYIAKQRDPMSGQMVEVEMDSTKSAKTQEALINYILSEIKYKREVRRVLFDALVMPYGVLWHGYKGDFGMTTEASMFIRKQQLFVKRLSPLRFVWDPCVTIANIDEARWIGRSFDVPMDDLLEDDTLDVDKKLIKGKVGYGQKVRGDSPRNGMDFVDPSPLASRALADFASDEYRKSSSSRFVTVHEIFQLPSLKQSRDGEKGRVWLLTDEQDKPLRVSRWPYKSEGWPAEILQFNEVQDSMLGLDDFSTYAPIVDQGNIIRNQQIRNAKQLNKVIIAASKNGMANEEDQQKIRSGENAIIMYDEDDVSKRLSVVTAAGGSSSELYLLDQRIDQKLERVSGVSDLKSGVQPKSGEESAISVKIRSAGGSARPSYRQDLMADFLRASIHKLNQMNKQFMTVDEVVRVVGSLDIQWSENPSKEEIQADTDVEMDVYSMLPEDPEQELRTLQTALMMGVETLSNPAVGQKLAQEGYIFEMAPLVEQILQRLKIRNPNVFRRIKPEESQGFAPVAELRAAKDNVNAALAGSPQLPSPPAPGQDHAARLEIYEAILQLIAEMGDSPALQMLTQLVQAHQMLMEEEMKKEAKPGTMLGKNMGMKPMMGEQRVA